MLKIQSNSTIYIFLPASEETGGPETLHQLCDSINRQGGDSRIIYTTT